MITKIPKIWNYQYYIRYNKINILQPKTKSNNKDMENLRFPNALS